MIKQYKILFAIHRYNELGYIYYLYSHIKNNAWRSVAKTRPLLTIDPPPRSSARLKLNKRCIFMWKGDGYVLSNNAVGLWDMGFGKSVKLIRLSSETSIQLLFFGNSYTLSWCSVFIQQFAICTFVWAQQIGNYCLSLSTGCVSISSTEGYIFVSRLILSLQYIISHCQWKGCFAPALNVAIL